MVSDRRLEAYIVTGLTLVGLGVGELLGDPAAGACVGFGAGLVAVAVLRLKGALSPSPRRSIRAASP